MKGSLAFLHRLSKREKIILAATSAVVGIFLLDRLILHPLVSLYHSVDGELLHLEADIKKSVRLLSQKNHLEEEFKKYASYSVQAKSAEEEAVALLKTIEGIAEEAGVNLVYVKPAAAKTEERLKKYYANLEFEAQMEQLMKFFYQVENSTQLLKIEKFSLQPSAEGSTVVRCLVTVSRSVV